MDKEKRTDEISPAAAVVGSTGGGKSALAMALCERHGGELVSVDSMQVYRTMDIGTAKPTKEEQARVRHHMIDVCAPDTPYSAADYAPAALAAVGEITARGNLPVFCGGTGLYLDSVLRGGAPEETASDMAVRETLHAELDFRRERVSAYGMIEEWGNPDMERYARAGVPKLAAAGVKKIGLANHFQNNMNVWGVSNMCCTVDYRIAESVGEDKFKLLCSEARRAQEVKCS